MEDTQADQIIIGYSHHKAPFYSPRRANAEKLLLRLQVKGTCRAIIKGQMMSIQPGDLIISKPGDTYQLIIEAEQSKNGPLPIDSVDYYLICNSQWIRAWCSRNAFPDQVNVDVPEELLSLWRRLVYEKRNINEDNTEVIEYLYKLLCLSLERCILKSKITSSRTELYVPYQIKQYIEKHATEPLTLSQLAQRFGISVSTASHLFKQTFGQSPMRYVREVRLMIASEKMQYSDEKLEDIACSSGFHSYPYFSRAFRAKYQMSPSAYRSRHP